MATDISHSNGKQEPSLQELLLRACQNGQVLTVQLLLQSDFAAVSQADALQIAEQLFVACAENGSLECLRLLVRKFRHSLNINAVDEESTPCLQLAVLGQCVEMVEYLLKCGADVNSRDSEQHTALHWAVVCKHHDIMTLLLVNGADVDLPDDRGGSVLHYAAHMCGRTEQTGEDTALLILQHLLYVRASVNCTDNEGRSPLLWAANAGSGKACKMLVTEGAKVDLADRNGLTALHCAATRGHDHVLLVLVRECKASIDVLDCRGCPPLFYAVNHCHADCVNALLRLGASVDCRDEKGRSVAHYAAEFGNLEIVKILLDEGCNFWQTSNADELPVHGAIRRSKRDISAFLLKQLGDKQKAAFTGCLHLSAGVNDTETIGELLQLGVSINAAAKYKNSYVTALDVAYKKKHHDCYRYIRSKGGVHGKGLVNSSARKIQRALRGAKARKASRHPPGEHSGEKPTPTADRTAEPDPTPAEPPWSSGAEEDISPRAAHGEADGVTEQAERGDSTTLYRCDDQQYEKSTSEAVSGENQLVPENAYGDDCALANTVTTDNELESGKRQTEGEACPETEYSESVLETDGIPTKQQESESADGVLELSEARNSMNVEIAVADGAIPIEKGYSDDGVGSDVCRLSTSITSDIAVVIGDMFLEQHGHNAEHNENTNDDVSHSVISPNAGSTDVPLGQQEDDATKDSVIMVYDESSSAKIEMELERDPKTAVHGTSAAADNAGGFDGAKSSSISPAAEGSGSVTKESGGDYSADHMDMLGTGRNPENSIMSPRGESEDGYVAIDHTHCGSSQPESKSLMGNAVMQAESSDGLSDDSESTSLQFTPQYSYAVPEMADAKERLWQDQQQLEENNTNAAGSGEKPHEQTLHKNDGSDGGVEIDIPEDPHKQGLELRKNDRQFSAETMFGSAKLTTETEGAISVDAEAKDQSVAIGMPYKGVSSVSGAIPQSGATLHKRSDCPEKISCKCSDDFPAASPSDGAFEVTEQSSDRVSPEQTTASGRGLSSVSLRPDDSVQVIAAGSSMPYGAATGVAVGRVRQRPKTSVSSSRSWSNTMVGAHQTAQATNSVPLRHAENAESMVAHRPSVHPSGQVEQTAPLMQPPSWRPKTSGAARTHAHLPRCLRIRDDVQSSVRQYETRKLAATSYRQLMRARQRAPVFSVVTILPTLPTTVHYDSSSEFPAIAVRKEKAAPKHKVPWQK